MHARDTGELLGSVSAASEAEAVFRLCGVYDRPDRYAVSAESRRYHQEAARRGHFIAAPYERD